MGWIVKVGVGEYLARAEMENNATEFYAYFNNKGFTLESVAGMLGNIQQESTINPGIKQTKSTSSGWGLIQWTPSTNLTEYATTQGSGWSSGEIQSQLIWDEIINGYGGQWIPKSEKGYGYTGKEFAELTDVNEACKAYLYERERAGIEALAKRLAYANNWYEFLTGVTPPTPPTPPTPKKRTSMPIYMMLRRL